MSSILVLTAERNSRLLSDWLTADLGHEVTDGEGDPRSVDGVDLCIVDAEGIIEHGEELRALKVDAHPVFVPLVLVVPGGYSDTTVSELDERLGGMAYLVDEILPMPVAKDVLENRIESLLRIRDQSKDLRESEARFRALVDQSLTGVFLASGNRFEYVNQRLADIFGYSREDLLGRDLDQMVAEVDRDRLASAVADYQAGDSPRINGTFEGRRADGEYLSFMLEAHRITLEDGEITLGTIVDISEQVRAERRSERRAEELALLNQIIRHDVRNDLNVLLGWGDTLYDHVDEEGRQILDRVLSTAHHIHELTVAVRDITDVLDEERETTLEPVDVTEILEIEIETVLARYEGTHEVSIEMPDPLPQGTEVLGSPMLASVFDNLLTNAVRHNNKSKAEITVGMDVGTETVAIHFADNGPGVSDAMKETIFGRGEKGLKSSGSGLGLYLVDTVVSEIGGEVSVADNDPTGAVFTVTLPLA